MEKRIAEPVVDSWMEQDIFDTYIVRGQRMKHAPFERQKYNAFEVVLGDDFRGI